MLLFSKIRVVCDCDNVFSFSIDYEEEVGIIERLSFENVTCPECGRDIMITKTFFVVGKDS